MQNPLGQLSLDYWYKVLVVVGFVVFLLTGAGLMHALPTAPALLMSAGAFWVGIGEWINHPFQSYFVAATYRNPAGTLSGYPRRASVLGSLLDLLGLGLIAAGIYRLV